MSLPFRHNQIGIHKKIINMYLKMGVLHRNTSFATPLENADVYIYNTWSIMAVEMIIVLRKGYKLETGPT
jgi:hypothetical protein